MSGNDANPYSFVLSDLDADNFSVVSLHSNHFSFNTNYYFKILFRRRNNIDLTGYIKKLGYLKTNKTIIHGVITNIKTYRNANHLFDEITLSSPLALLNIKPRSAVYADSDFIKLMTTVLGEAGWEYKSDFDFLLNATYPTRKYIAQYQETDYEFILRHCANWGIFFSFIQKENKPLLIFSDDMVAFERYFPVINLPFNFSDHLNHDDSCIQEVMCKRKVLTKTVRLNDYNPETPSLPLKLESTTLHTVNAFGVDYRPYEYYENKATGEMLLNRRLEHYDCNREIFSGVTDRSDLQLGQHITIVKHPIESLNGDYHIIGIEHKANIEENNNHSLKLQLLKAHIPFRPALNKLFNMPDTTASIISDHVNEQGNYFISPHFDERKQENSNPTRLSQPITGRNSGFHFPLRKGTDVLISHINGDPDRPIIMGAIPNEKSPNPVTDINTSQHIIQTTKGNNLLFDDNLKNPSILMSTLNKTESIKLNNDGIGMESTGTTVVQADKKIIQNTEGDYIQTTNNNHIVDVEGLHAIKTYSDNVVFQSGNNLNVEAENKINIQANENININAENEISISAKQKIGVEASQISIQSKSNIEISAKAIGMQSTGKIIISQSGASIVVDDGGVTLNAKKISFSTNQFNASAIQVNGTAGETVTDNVTQTPLTVNFYDENQNPLNPEFSNFFVGNTHAGIVTQQIILPDIKEENPIISHEQLPAIAVNGKQHAPKTSYLLPSRNNNINCLRDPIYKRVHHSDDWNYHCDALSSEEINYFKQQGNNVLIFIHGYNVEDGKYPGKNIDIIDIDKRLKEMGAYEEAIADQRYLLNTSGCNWTTLRTLQEVIAELKAENKDPSAIEYIQNYYTDQSDYYDTVNGTGSCNWLLHMEYNLNCAASGNYPFNWEKDALHYTRILNIHWPAYHKIIGIPGSSHLRFQTCEFNAIATAYALLPTIQKLKQAGLAINIIAHSLGSLVTIKLLDLLGRNSESPIDHVILWQPALSDDALSTQAIPLMEAKRKEMQADQDVAHDMDFYYDYLHQLLGDSKELWRNVKKMQPKAILNFLNRAHRNSCEYYAKNPFSYFPNAYKAANQFTVLYSENDNFVLGDAFHIDKVFEDVNHINNKKNIPDSSSKAMGYYGPDKATISEKTWIRKLNTFDQTGILLGHSAMRIPTQEVFDKIYIPHVYKGLRKFGKY